MVWFSELIWDDWNEEHIARHGVRISEATEAVRNAPSLTRARDDTYRVIAQTDAGRYLFVILAPELLEAYYVVTARDATRDVVKENTHGDTRKEGDEADSTILFARRDGRILGYA